MNALHPLLVVGLLQALAMAGCTSDASGPQGALELALARARPAQSAGTQPLSALGSALIEQRITLRFEVPDAPQELVIERRVERRVGGGLASGPARMSSQSAFRLSDRRAHTERSAADPTVNRTRDDHFQAVFDGQSLAVQRGDGAFIERDVLDGLPARLLANVLDSGRFFVASFKDYLRFSPLDAADVPTGTPPAAGRLGVGTLEVTKLSVAGAGAPNGGVQWQSVAHDPGVQPKRLSVEELTSLRDNQAQMPLWLAATHQVTRASGMLAMASGEVLAGRLRIEGSTRLGAATVSFALTFEQAVSSLPAAASFELPPARLPEARERPWKMVVDVLGEALLPPYQPRP